MKEVKELGPAFITVDFECVNNEMVHNVVFIMALAYSDKLKKAYYYDPKNDNKEKINKDIDDFVKEVKKETSDKIFFVAWDNNLEKNVFAELEINYTLLDAKILKKWKQDIKLELVKAWYGLPLVDYFTDLKGKMKDKRKNKPFSSGRLASLIGETALDDEFQSKSDKDIKAVIKSMDYEKLIEEAKAYCLDDAYTALEIIQRPETKSLDKLDRSINKFKLIERNVNDHTVIVNLIKDGIIDINKSTKEVTRDIKEYFKKEVDIFSKKYIEDYKNKNSDI